MKILENIKIQTFKNYFLPKSHRPGYVPIHWILSSFDLTVHCIQLGPQHIVEVTIFPGFTRIAVAR